MLRKDIAELSIQLIVSFKNVFYHNLQLHPSIIHLKIKFSLGSLTWFIYDFFSETKFKTIRNAQVSHPPRGNVLPVWKTPHIPASHYGKNPVFCRDKAPRDLLILTSRGQLKGRLCLIASLQLPGAPAFSLENIITRIVETLWVCRTKLLLQDSKGSQDRSLLQTHAPRSVCNKRDADLPSEVL